MEELILNENLLTELPACIGFLRNLHTLIADCNKLSYLPDSICSCTRLRILSLADNNLNYLPDDIGRLSNLQVFNLCNNNLSYLPFSLTKIANIKSLWLSENQNKPLMQFHSELMENSFKKILTCFLLPQSKNNEPESADNTIEPNIHNPKRKLSFLTVSIDKPLINFNFDELHEDHGDAKLLRQPTPYPKDLKVHARHARNLVLKHLDLGNINLESVEKSECEQSSKTY